MPASSHPPALTRLALAGQVKAKARELGFDLVGIAPASPSMYADHVRAWLAAGRAGEMHYMHRRVEERLDPARFLPGARSVVCVAVNYHFPLEPLADDQQNGRGRVARYALGNDYHELIKPRLYDLADWLRDTVPGSATKCGVDTVPVLERELAQRAGLGWIGKNTCVIHRRVGSWLLLGEVITTVDLPSDEPETDHCGTCTRCIDACPTAAITGPRQVDATRCISYLTIEHAGPIAPELGAKMGDWVYGCDICQDVCPFNRKAPHGTNLRFRPRSELATGTLSLDDMLSWQPGVHNPTTTGTAIKRVKLPMLQRNARVATANAERRANPTTGDSGTRSA
jgi:epoxyqueuosine reductase